MNVLFISDTVYPYFKGGKEKRLDVFSRALAAKGMHVEIWTMKWWSGSRVLSDGGRTLRAICPVVPIYTQSRRRSLWEPIRFSWAVFCQFFRPSPDLIDVDHIPYLPLFAARLLAWRWKIPLVATWHEVWGRTAWKRYLGRGVGWLAAAVEWFSFRIPDRIIAVSPFTFRRLREVGIAEHKLTMIPNGIDLDEIDRIPASSVEYDVMTAGRLLRHKGIVDLLKATHQLKEEGIRIRLAIVGEGPERQPLEALSHSLGLEDQVHFLGFLPNSSDVYRVMKQSRVCALPSFREGFGIVALEANACGLPVLTIQSPDNAMVDLIKDGQNGMVVAPTVEALSEGLRNLLHNEDKRFLLAQRAQTMALQYQWDDAVQRLESTFHEWKNRSDH